MGNAQKIEVDRPPAGTPCSVCKEVGHFCPATSYAGDSDLGLCAACAADEWCAATKLARRKPADVFEIPPVTPEDKVEMMAILQDDEEEDHRLLSEKAKQAHLEREERARATSLSPVIRGDRPVYKISEETKAAIIAAPLSEDHRVLAKKHGVSVTSVDNIRKRAGLIPDFMRKGPYKAEQREEAKAMLINGSSTREAAAAVNLSRNIIVEVRREIPDLPAKANNGGMPMHKPKPPEAKPTENLSRAFELVIAELEKNIECVFDMAGETEEEKEEWVKGDRAAVGILRSYHPAVLGYSSSTRESVYDRALKQAEADATIVYAEMQRLTKRHEALTNIIIGLKQNVDAERDTR